MLSPKDMRELTEFENEVKEKHFSEEGTLRIVAMYSNWIERRKRNERITITGLIVATLIVFLLLCGVIPAKFYNFYSMLGIVTVVASCVLPAFDTNYGRHISLLKEEIIELKNR